MAGDRSQGWEAVAGQLAAARSRAHIGADVVRGWAGQLEPRSAVVDIGCGSGEPVPDILAEAGHLLWGIDASPTLAAIYRARFPSSTVTCEAAEDSGLFGRQFDAAVAVGLLFLLPAESQRAIIARVGQALNPGGRFLFTAPRQACEWDDVLTGEKSLSLGHEAYRQALEAASMRLQECFTDEGENHYYSAIREGPDPRHELEQA